MSSIRLRLRYENEENKESYIIDVHEVISVHHIRILSCLPKCHIISFSLFPITPGSVVTMGYQACPYHCSRGTSYS